MYEDRLKELRIFNLNKDMVKNIMDNVKKNVTRCSPFPETRKKGNLHSRKGTGAIGMRPAHTVKLESTETEQHWGVWLFSSNST